MAATVPTARICSRGTTTPDDWDSRLRGNYVMECAVPAKLNFAFATSSSVTVNWSSHRLTWTTGLGIALKLLAFASLYIGYGASAWACTYPPPNTYPGETLGEAWQRTQPTVYRLRSAQNAHMQEMAFYQSEIVFLGKVERFETTLGGRTGKERAAFVRPLFSLKGELPPNLFEVEEPVGGCVTLQHYRSAPNGKEGELVFVFVSSHPLPPFELLTWSVVASDAELPQLISLLKPADIAERVSGEQP